MPRSIRHSSFVGLCRFARGFRLAVGLGPRLLACGFGRPNAPLAPERMMWHVGLRTKGASSIAATAAASAQPASQPPCAPMHSGDRSPRPSRRAAPAAGHSSEERPPRRRRHFAPQRAAQAPLPSGSTPPSPAASGRSTSLPPDEASALPAGPGSWTCARAWMSKRLTPSASMQ